MTLNTAYQNIKRGLAAARYVVCLALFLWPVATIETDSFELKE